ncbi:MAG: ATP-binding protein [Pseudonocardiaceae bacterium]
MTAALALELPTRMTPLPAHQPRATDGQLLAALPSAVGSARRFIRFTLELWRLFDLIDTAESVVVELVTDAIRATGIAVEHPGYLDLYEKQVNLLELRVHLTDTHVVLLVWDTDPSPPWPREPAPEPRRSRNFYLPPHGGKVVWVALEIAVAARHEEARRLALPRRAGYPRRPVPPAPVRPVKAMTDPVLLERVRDGLHRLATQPPGLNPDSPGIPQEEP